MSLWFEKYRPTDLADIVVSEKKLEILDKWFTDFKAGTGDKCALLFTGPPGLGKTSLAHVILKRYGYTVKEFNATDIRSRALVNENLDSLINFTNINRISEQRDVVTGIIMDEVDGMFKGDRGGIDELLDFISAPSTRNKKKATVRRVPIICICNIGNVKRDIIKQLQKECTEINFTLPDTTNMLKVIGRIALLEGLTFEGGTTDAIIAFAQGDYRRLINILEFLKINYGANVKREHVEETCNILSKKDKDVHITDNIKRILNDIHPCDVIAGIYNGDKSKVPMVVHQNYIRAINMQKTSYANKITGIKKCIDSLVVADVLEKVMYTTQSWHLQTQHGIACTYVPHFYINKYTKIAAAGSVWASILSISSQSQNLKKNLYEIIYRIPGRRSYSINDVQLLTEVILHHIIHGDYEKAVKIIAQYNICDLNDFKTKKCIAVFDKLVKFIKISSYIEKWSKFKEDAKQNKTLDAEIKKYIDKYNTNQIKITLMSKTPVIEKPKKKIVFKKKIQEPSDLQEDPPQPPKEVEEVFSPEPAPIKKRIICKKKLPVEEAP
jgi:DNA polymerase III delta prime subunit